MDPSTNQVMHTGDEEAHEASMDVKKWPKMGKMCPHLLMVKLVMHNLEFLTLLLSSDEGCENQDTTESKDEEPHYVVYR